MSIAAPALDRHQHRRDSGQPTVSVLAGPVALAAKAGRVWAGRRGWSLVEVDDPRLDAMVGAWARRLVAERDLVGDVALRLGQSVDGFKARIGRMGGRELGSFCESALPGHGGPDVEAVCRWILERSASGDDLDAPPGLAARLASASVGGSVERAFAALGTLIPPGEGPVLLAVTRLEALTGFDEAARSIARLSLAYPQLPAILATDRELIDRYLEQAPESREKAIIRSGVVHLAVEAVPTPIPAPIPAQSSLEADDRARSEAERFLFERLEAMRSTAGLFALNPRVDIPFGLGQSMEVDLLAISLKLVIEIDGYHHFQDRDAYRRDRRKDYLLQSRGYLVVRVLAEDVVSHLEAILALILDAIETRRAPELSSHQEVTG